MVMIKRLPIFGLLGLFLVAAVFVYSRPKTTPPPNTSTDISKGSYDSGLFSISYPDMFNLEERPTNEYNKTGKIVMFYTGTKATSSCSLTHMEISINSAGMCGSLAFKGTTSDIKTSSAKLLGVDVERYDDFVKDVADPVEVRFSTFTYKGSVVSISYFITPKDYPRLTELTAAFETMLKSLK